MSRYVAATKSIDIEQNILGPQILHHNPDLVAMLPTCAVDLNKNIRLHVTVQLQSAGVDVTPHYCRC